MTRLPAFLALVAVLSMVLGDAEPAGSRPDPGGTQSFDPEGRELYEAGCALCHGFDGVGPDPERVTLDVPMPDFTDCSFATREPDADWIAVSHEGGPVRGFSETMPAFGEAYSVDQLQQIVDYIRTFCGNPAWPPGELNFPRPLVTEKAYPEDEIVWTVLANTEGPAEVENEFVYERRIGSRHQVEVIVPVLFKDSPAESSSGSEFGIGDVALGFKSAVWHDAGSGSILALGGELKLPTGSESRGLGRGATVVEPLVSFGQSLPSDGFAHAHANVNVPFDTEANDPWGNLRVVLGKTWTTGVWGRSWSPMAELLMRRDFREDGPTNWTLVPQMQVSLNTRQHVLGNVGLAVPLNRADVRSTQLMIYVLWEWFDGGLFAGW